MQSGSCLCKAVKFEVEGQLPGASACHCTICRKITGHYEAGVDVKRSAVKISGNENLTWYHSSEKVRRGFCKTCGSALFFDLLNADWIGISMGVFDGPTNTKLERHIFMGDKGDYYEINDGAKQYVLYPGAENQK